MYLDEPRKIVEALELTDEKLIKLVDLCVLAVNLGIYLHVDQEGDMSTTSYKTIRFWYNQQSDRTSAFENMCRALREADMTWLISAIE